MLSPSTSALGPPATKSAPMTNAWANPFGSGCTAYSMRMPHCDPSPSKVMNPACSCGVVMISTSRMPASMSVVSG